jgi:hypothetical protein
MKEKIGYFNEAGFLEIAIFRSTLKWVQQIVYWAWIIEMLFLFNLKIRRLALIEKSKIINQCLYA